MVWRYGKSPRWARADGVPIRLGLSHEAVLFPGRETSMKKGNGGSSPRTHFPVRFNTGKGDSDSRRIVIFPLRSRVRPTDLSGTKRLVCSTLMVGPRADEEASLKAAVDFAAEKLYEVEFPNVDYCRIPFRQ